MKILCLMAMTIFSFSLSANESHLSIGKLYQQNQKLESLKESIYRGQIPQDKESFRRLFSDLSETQKSTTLSFVETFDHVIPEYFMTPLLYWRFVNPVPQKVSQTLEAYFLSRYFLIRETALTYEFFLDSPEKAREWYQLNQEIFPQLSLVDQKNSQKGSQFKNGLILQQEQLEILNYRAKTLSKIKQDKAFEQSLKETPALSHDEYFKSSDKNKITKLVEGIGPIPGNHFETLPLNSSGKIELKEKTKEMVNQSSNLEVYISSNFWKHLTKKGQQFLQQNVKDESLHVRAYAEIKSHTPGLSPEYAIFFAPEGESSIYWQRSEQAMEESSIFYISGPASDLYAYQLAHNYNKPSKSSRETASLFSFEKESLKRGDKTMRLISSKNQKFHLINLIDQASESLLINAEHLYHPQIVEALIRKKLQDSNMNIRVLLHVAPEKNPNALPSVIFIDQLKKAGIKVVAHIGNQKELNTEFFVADQKTLYYPVCGFVPLCQSEIIPGHMGITIYNENESQEIAEHFQEVWQDPKVTRNFNTEDFQAKGEDGILTKESSQLFNYSMSMLLNAWDNLGFEF